MMGRMATMVLALLALLVVGALVLALVVQGRRVTERLEATVSARMGEALSAAVGAALTDLREDHERSERHAAAAAGMRDQAVSRELDAKRDLIDHRLAAVESAVGRRLDAVATAVESLQRASAERFGSLDQALAMHAETTRSLTATTHGLREALASPKARGQWGERMAEDVLRLAGFREGFNYVKQTSVADGSGVPDFTFTLPKGHKLFLDVKFPLSAYLRFLDAESDTERSTHRAQFLRDVKLRVRELARRHYTTDASSLDYVLLFVPNEAISGFMHETDASLIDEALGQRVVLCSPLTLFALLAVVRQAHDAFLTEQRSDEIQKLMGQFSKQWTMFTDQLDKVQRTLDTAVRSYEDLNGVRRRQVQRPLDKIEVLRGQHDTEDGDVRVLDFGSAARELPA
jgi:DNA recombination protein RmuC